MLDLHVRLFYSLNKWGLGFAYRMLKSQKQNTLHENESSEEYSVSL